MIASIIISVYLLVGIIIAYYNVKKMDSIVQRYENGEKMDKEEEETLNSLENLMFLVSGKTALTVVYIVSTIFWLPMGFVWIASILNKKKG